LFWSQALLPPAQINFALLTDHTQKTADSHFYLVFEQICLQGVNFAESL
jgi:hypothetical protein